MKWSKESIRPSPMPRRGALLFAPVLRPKQSM
jgi:hypothetical protein